MPQVVSAGWEGVSGSLESHGVIALNRPPLLLLPWADLVPMWLLGSSDSASVLKSGLGVCLSPGLGPGVIPAR